MQFQTKGAQVMQFHMHLSVEVFKTRYYCMVSTEFAIFGIYFLVFGACEYVRYHVM